MLDPKEKQKLKDALSIIDENLFHSEGDLLYEIIELLKGSIEDYTDKLELEKPGYEKYLEKNFYPCGTSKKKNS